VRRPDNLLSLALLVSALLFLTACPFKAGGPANSGPSAEGPDGEPIVHHFGSGSWGHHQKPIRFSLPKPPHASRSTRLLSQFFEDHHSPAGSRPAPW
jgi:hypothetical protein